MWEGEVDDKTKIAAMSGAARDVLAERERQISEEGWAPEHDDAHAYGEMAKAAACYATGFHPLNPYSIRPGGRGVRSIWPWAQEWWKPKDRRRDLVRAGALILAEIERIDRKEARDVR